MLPLVASLGLRFPPLRTTLLAVAAGLAAAALVLREQERRSRRAVRVEPQPLRDAPELPWGDA